MKPHVLLLTGLFPENLKDDIIKNSKGNVQNAANNLQWEIVRGFDENLDSEITIINSVYIGSYPKRYKKIIMRKNNFSHNGLSKDINTGFINLPFIKIFSRYLSIKNQIKKWLLYERNTHNKVVIAYAMTLPMVWGLIYAKRVDKSVKTVLIIPDLPIYMNLNQSVHNRISLLRNVYMNNLNRKIKSIDSFVLLTKYMHEKLPIGNKPYVIVEGIAPIIKHQEATQKYHNDFLVVYAGGLSEEYGTILLLKNFNKLIGDNYKLILCGHGNQDTLRIIQDYTIRDKRIEFKGLLKHEEVIKLQMSANLLVNPRSNNSEFTKYSFPSKTLEYMATGKPVLAYKLKGIPDEYDEYYFHIIDGPNGIHDSINNIVKLNKQDVLQKGLSAREFVTLNKNSKTQVKKILEMIHQLY